MASEKDLYLAYHRHFDCTDDSWLSTVSANTERELTESVIYP